MLPKTETADLMSFGISPVFALEVCVAKIIDVKFANSEQLT